MICVLDHYTNLNRDHGHTATKHKTWHNAHVSLQQKESRTRCGYPHTVCRKCLTRVMLKLLLVLDVVPNGYDARHPRSSTSSIPTLPWIYIRCTRYAYPKATLKTTCTYAHSKQFVHGLQLHSPNIRRTLAIERGRTYCATPFVTGGAPRART